MEPFKDEIDVDEPERFRLRLILGKLQVTSVVKGAIGLRATIALGNSVTMTLDCPFAADIRLHDKLTFYTEVPYALPGEPPK